MSHSFVRVVRRQITPPTVGGMGNHRHTPNSQFPGWYDNFRNESIFDAFYTFKLSIVITFPLNMEVRQNFEFDYLRAVTCYSRIFIGIQSIVKTHSCFTGWGRFSQLAQEIRSVGASVEDIYYRTCTS